jgi:peroxiredoxin
MKRLLLVLFFAAAASAGALFGADQPGRLQPGDLAPDFTVTGPNGEPVKLSDFRGRYVLLDLWATWCAPCVAAMPHNDELARALAPHDLVLLAVCASDTPENYAGWVRRNGARYAFRTAFDPAGRSNWAESVFNLAYGVNAFPTLFLIDREGRIVGSASGGGVGENPAVTRLLARGGLPVKTDHLPPESTAGAATVPVSAAPTVAAGAPAPAAAPMMMGMGRAAPNRFGALAVDEVVPDFTVSGADGRDLKLSSFRGQPVLVHFFTLGGRLEPEIDEVLTKYRDQGLKVLAIGVAGERDRFDAAVAATQTGATLAFSDGGPAALESVNNTVFGVGMFPARAVIRADGTLAGGFIGFTKPNLPRLHALLAQAGLQVAREDLPAVMPATAMRPMTPAPAPAAGAAAAPEPPATLGAGAMAPDFAARTVDGGTVRLSDLRGKVVILDFWAPWCGPCIAAFPHVQSLAAKYQDQGVVVLAAGTSDTIANFESWIPKNRERYPDIRFAYDPAERRPERVSSALYGVRGIPSQFVIDRDGKITALVVGFGGEDDKRTEAALARAGIKVDAAVAAAGEEKLRAEAKQAEANKPGSATAPPPFRENYGRIAAGSEVPDFRAQSATGADVSFAELARGKSTVLLVFSGGSGPGDEALAYYDRLAREYRDRGVQVVGLGAYANREDFDRWHAEQAGKLAFPVIFDPAGRFAGRDPATLTTDEERKAERERSAAHFAKVIPVSLSGVMTPVPTTIVVDAERKLVGWFAGHGAASREAVGNLLLRAGVELAAADRPTRVFTAAETKPPAPEAKVEPLKIGALAPDFTTQDLDGKPVKLSDYRGKVVVLDFWAPWCGPCIAAMPHTQEVAARYKEHGVVVLGSCTSDARDRFENWVRTNQSKYPDIIWSHDPAERKPERVSRALYGVTGIPTQFIIDREGRVVDIVVGYLPGEVILDAALAKAGVPVGPGIVEQAQVDLARRANR